MSGGDVDGVAADVATGEGRAATLERAMIEVDLVAPILLTRAALPALRARGAGLVVNIPSEIALFGVPFYAPHAAAKAGLARIGEALRRELKGEGVQVLTVYPGGTDTPMMKSNRPDPSSASIASRPAPLHRRLSPGSNVLRSDR